MRQDSTGSGVSLLGVAALAACSCGTSSHLGGFSGTFGHPAGAAQIHPFFVAVGSVLILAGLWRHEIRVRLLAVLGVAMLLASELLARPMSILPGVPLTTSQISGFTLSLLAAVALVAAFYNAYSFKESGAALTAMTGSAMALGCNCCLVTMGLTGMARLAFPSATWLFENVTVYSVAVTLMATGLFRIAGIVPAVTAVIGQAFLYFWLELPYKSMPDIIVHGANVNFIIKYPMMLVGAGAVMAGFAYAYRRQEVPGTSSRIPEPAFGD